MNWCPKCGANISTGTGGPILHACANTGPVGNCLTTNDSGVIVYCLTHHMDVKDCTIALLKAEVDQLKGRVDKLKDTLEAERIGTPCGPDCGGGGWRECFGCDARIKDALKEM